MADTMAAKTKKAKASKTSPKASSKGTSKSAAKSAAKPAAKTAKSASKPTAKPKATSAKAASAKKTPIKAKATTKATSKTKAAPLKNKEPKVKATTKIAAPLKAPVKVPHQRIDIEKPRIKTPKAGLPQEVSTKVRVKSKASDDRRSQAAALIEAAMEDEEDEDDDDEFDPEAFLAASGGKGLIRSHVMRKERVDLNLPVRYRFTKGPLVFNAILLNLSKSGICLESKEKVKDKTVLRIEIPLPHTSELFAIQAEVIWSEKAPGSPNGKAATFHIGMNFLVMSLAKKTVINNFIQQRRDEIVMAKIGLDRFSESVPVAGLD